MKLEFEKRRPKEGIMVRLSSPLGMYPKEMVGDFDNAFYRDEELAFTIVRFSELPEENNYYSEVEWAHPQEIAFFASMVLARRKGEGAVIFYPLPIVFYPILPAEQNLSEPLLHNSLKNYIINYERQLENTIFGNIFSVVDKSILPSCFSGKKYNDSGRGFDPSLQILVKDKINPTDSLLIRGLSTLIRSDMVSRHYQFLEEAILSLFISLEASHQLVLRKLKAEGTKKPTTKDAANFIDEAFKNPYQLDRYFKEYYISRTMAVHPVNRYGCFPHAPLMVDDFYHLHEDLREIYLYLLTGYIEKDSGP